MLNFEVVVGPLLEFGIVLGVVLGEPGQGGEVVRWVVRWGGGVLGGEVVRWVVVARL